MFVGKELVASLSMRARERPARCAGTATMRKIITVSPRRIALRGSEMAGEGLLLPLPGVFPMAGMLLLQTPVAALARRLVEGAVVEAALLVGSE